MAALGGSSLLSAGGVGVVGASSSVAVHHPASTGSTTTSISASVSGVLSSSPAAAATAAPSRAQVVVSSPMPDLSHLTEDERRIIESVLMRQRREEEQETEIVRLVLFEIQFIHFRKFCQNFFFIWEFVEFQIFDWDRSLDYSLCRAAIATSKKQPTSLSLFAGLFLKLTFFATVWPPLCIRVFSFQRSQVL